MIDWQREAERMAQSAWQRWTCLNRYRKESHSKNREMEDLMFQRYLLRELVHQLNSEDRLLPAEREAFERALNGSER